MFDWFTLNLIVLTWRIWWAPHNASRWQLGLNSAFKGLSALTLLFYLHYQFSACAYIFHWHYFIPQPSLITSRRLAQIMELRSATIKMFIRRDMCVRAEEIHFRNLL